MNLKLLQVLVCPACKADLRCDSAEEDSAGDVVSGILACGDCGKEYPIENGIPRFLPSSSYASSFGFQWNRFRQEQLDTFNGIRQSTTRLLSETGWDEQWMKGKWVLDVGCGAGRFLDVCSQHGCEIVGIDLTNAVDAAQANLAGRSNVHLVQASIYDLPFPDEVFDGCYCIGVIQHTPDPERSVRALPRVVKPGGKLAITVYERKWYTPLNAKYLVRHLTKRIGNVALLRLLRAVMPVAFLITEVLFRIPFVGRGFMFFIPVANYVHDPELSIRQRYQWAILDTFDMLSPQFDQPQREADVVDALFREGVREIRRLDNSGLNLTGTKPVASSSLTSV
jgi:ubiquinone/menaquinone biosynthesis C-methylase UbiE/uncharacterized protein YbaR (Trm112 family)